MKTKSNLAAEPTRVLLACNHESDVQSMTEVLDQLDPPVLITQTTERSLYFSTMQQFEPDIVVAGYDFGIFPFLNKARERTPSIPFVVISELELPQNALKSGINIYILKQELAFLPLWIDIIVSFSDTAHPENSAVLADKFVRALQRSTGPFRMPASREQERSSVHFASAPRKPSEERQLALKRWEEEAEIRQMKRSHSFSPQKISRPDPLLDSEVEEGSMQKNMNGSCHSQEGSADSYHKSLEEIKELRARLESKIDLLAAQMNSSADEELPAGHNRVSLRLP